MGWHWHGGAQGLLGWTESWIGPSGHNRWVENNTDACIARGGSHLHYPPRPLPSGVGLQNRKWLPSSWLGVLSRMECHTQQSRMSGSLIRDKPVCPLLSSLANQLQQSLYFMSALKQNNRAKPPTLGCCTGIPDEPPRNVGELKACQGRTRTAES